MQSFENRTHQLETKPKTQISENSVESQEDEGKSPKALPTAWTNVSSQLNPDRDKIFNFSTKTSDQNFSGNLAIAPRFLFGAPTRNQVVLPMAGPHTLSPLNPDQDKIFGFSGPENFQGASGATTSAAHGFKCEAWQICKLPRRTLLPHTQMMVRITRILSDCLTLLRTRNAQASSHEIQFHKTFL